MSVIEEVKRLQQAGRSDQEILSSLVNQGFQAKDVQESLTQARIKDAVVANPANMPPQSIRQMSATQERMNPSLMASEQAVPAQQDYALPQEYPPQEDPQYSQQNPYPPQAMPSPYQQQIQPPTAQDYPYGEYSQQSAEQQQDTYSSYSSNGLSTDTINEISEQVVAEKLSPLMNKIEEVLSFKNVLESKIEHLDERLKRIERTIDRLQLSVLQKVGDYMTNVEDIKKELVETQKTFKSMVANSQAFREK